VTRFDLHRRHVGDVHIGKIGRVLASGIEEAELEKEKLGIWRKQLITPKQLMPWIDGALQKECGDSRQLCVLSILPRQAAMLQL